MTRTIATDNKNDIYVLNNGNLATTYSLPATQQNCETAVKAQLGEMIYAIDQGMPNFQTVWNGAPNVAQFESYLRKTILAVENVLEITELTITSQGGILSYQATILTTFGSGILNG